MRAHSFHKLRLSGEPAPRGAQSTLPASLPAIENALGKVVETKNVSKLITRCFSGKILPRRLFAGVPGGVANGLGGPRSRGWPDERDTGQRRVTGGEFGAG